MPASVDAVADVVRDSYRRGKAHALIVVAEGVSGGGDRLASELAAKHADVGFDVRLTRIGHVQRVAAAAIRETPLDQVTGRIKPIDPSMFELARVLRAMSARAATHQMKRQVPSLRNRRERSAPGAVHTPRARRAFADPSYPDRRPYVSSRVR